MRLARLTHGRRGDGPPGTPGDGQGDRGRFAERLREWGVDAEATRQAVRGAVRNYPDLWRKRAAEQGRERKKRPDRKMGEAAVATRRSAGKAGRSLPRPCEDRLIPPINGLLVTSSGS